MLESGCQVELLVSIRLSEREVFIPCYSLLVFCVVYAEIALQLLSFPFHDMKAIPLIDKSFFATKTMA